MSHQKDKAQEMTYHSMHLLWGNQTTLVAVFITSLILGIPLAINKWWHLRVNTDKSGRGVIKLIRISHFFSLLSVLVILFDLVVLFIPSHKLPPPICLTLEWLVFFIMCQRFHSGLPIALGR